MHLDLTDRLSMKDISNLNSKGELSSGLVGEVTARVPETGEILFKKHNTILIGGKTFVLAKLFNLDISGVRDITFNEQMGHNVNEDSYDYIGPRREKAICLFGVGVGGSGLTLGSVYSPNPRENALYEQIPFRYVDSSNDLSDEEKMKYYFRIEEAEKEKIAYYLKRFDSDPTLVRRAGTVDYVPSVTDNQRVDNTGIVINRTAVDTYVEMVMTIGASDIREYFTANNDLSNARVNEIGLYAAYQPDTSNPATWKDYRGATLFSKITFNNEPLSNYSKSIEITYRIYC
jgi:hypothetical protein